MPFSVNSEAFFRASLESPESFLRVTIDPGTVDGGDVVLLQYFKNLARSFIRSFIMVESVRLGQIIRGSYW